MTPPYDLYDEHGEDEADRRRMEARERRRKRLAAEAKRRARQRRTVAVGACLMLVVVVAVVGRMVLGALAVRGAHTPDVAVAATVTVEASPSVDPTSPPAGVDATASSEPDTSSVAATGTPEAVAAYAVAYPGPPSLAPTVITRLKPKRKLVAITLDDGIPFDTRILDLFEREHVRATTFVLGQFARSKPELMKRLDKDGFEIANHTWDHKILTHLSSDKIRSELSKTQQQISKTTGNQAPYMRPPGGGYNSRVKQIAGSMGYRVVMWSRSLADTSRSATPRQCYKNAVNNVQPGEIILCHWGRPATYEALKLIIPELKRRGFEIVTVSELIEDSGGPEALK